MISTLNEALRDNPQLEVSILTDALRGTRESPDPSCASLLATLVAEHGDRVQISMFHTPNLTSWRKYIPKRLNEGWGLQHMKLYGFDDEIMLSGCDIVAVCCCCLLTDPIQERICPMTTSQTASIATICFLPKSLPITTHVFTMPSLRFHTEFCLLQSDGKGTYWNPH